MTDSIPPVSALKSPAADRQSQALFSINVIIIDRSQLLIEPDLIS